MRIEGVLLVLLAGLSCAAAGLTYLGHDVSSLLMLEGEGVTYRFANGTTAPLEYILVAGGANAVRSRLWVNPVGGYYNLAYNVKLATRMQKVGLKFYLDIHFSDTWADPGHQTIPAGWPTTLAGLLTTVYAYTKNVTQTFVNNNIHVEMISIGNEIRNGLLWPVGTTSNWTNIAALLKQASLGIKAAAPTNTPKILIHLDNGWNWAAQESWYDNVLKYNFALTDFDIQGLSFYPFYGTGATFVALNTSMSNMSNKYKKELLVAETDYPEACSGGPALSEPSIPVSVAGQTQWVTDVISVVEKAQGARGAGIFYWEPAWIGSPKLGSGCQDNLLFTATTSKIGTARASINMYK